MSGTTSRVRRARKMHLSCCKPIQPGDLYVEHTEFPGGESGYADAAGHPVHMAECRDCAERYGRSGMITAYLAAAAVADNPPQEDT